MTISYFSSHFSNCEIIVFIVLGFYKIIDIIFKNLSPVFRDDITVWIEVIYDIPVTSN